MIFHVIKTIQTNYSNKCRFHSIQLPIEYLKQTNYSKNINCKYLKKNVKEY